MTIQSDIIHEGVESRRAINDSSNAVDDSDYSRSIATGGASDESKKNTSPAIGSILFLMGVMLFIL